MDTLYIKIEVAYMEVTPKSSAIGKKNSYNLQ